mmetsp:Transcript_38662/g.56835  ORF Transcript_38662/g.56835 Transcript_38662/m.56835 type:complete len:161 (-) Transcript_38662:614-1096(-)
MPTNAQSRRTFECDVTRSCLCGIFECVAHSNETCPTYEGVMSHTWMSHITRMNKTHANVLCRRMCHGSLYFLAGLFPRELPFAGDLPRDIGVVDLPRDLAGVEVFIFDGVLTERELRRTQSSPAASLDPLASCLPVNVAMKRRIHSHSTIVPTRGSAILA